MIRRPRRRSRPDRSDTATARRRGAAPGTALAAAALAVCTSACAPLFGFGAGDGEGTRAWACHAEPETLGHRWVEAVGAVFIGVHARHGDRISEAGGPEGGPCDPDQDPVVRPKP